MLYKSQVYTQASGSIGGITYSHNAGGLYTRARAIPVNPNTGFQQTIRSLFATLGNAWQNILTAPLRDSWETYASNYKLTNALGELINISGVAMFARNNTARLQAGLARVDDAPTIFTGGPSDPTLEGAASEATQDLTITFDDTLPWVDEDGAGLLVYISRPQGPTINFFKGPYRFAGSIDGNATLPETSPGTVTAPFVFVAGQVLHVRIVIVGADGRIGPNFRFRSVAAA